MCSTENSRKPVVGIVMNTQWRETNSHVILRNMYQEHSAHSASFHVFFFFLLLIFIFFVPVYNMNRTVLLEALLYKSESGPININYNKT